MHSIITNDNTWLGEFNLKAYESCFKDLCERYKQKLISFILSTKLFNELDPRIFKMSYFSMFFSETFSKGKKILSQEKANDYIYIIRDGDFELSLKSTMIDLNYVIKYLGSEPEPDRINEKSSCIRILT